MIDILIVGGGIAGLSAAITAKARNKDVMIIGNDITTSAIYKAERIDNYPGFCGATGKELLDAFCRHAERVGVVVIKDKVKQILSMGEYFTVNAGDSFYETKTVVLAVGTNRGGGIKGESEFLGKGLSYCATCDGMLYRGKTVVVSGESSETLSEALFLSEICKKVILSSEKDIHNELLDKKEKIELKMGRIKEITGEKTVTAVVTDTETIECDGVFLIRDGIPAKALIYGLEMSDGVISTDKNMKTSIQGVFAAGDCTGKPLQISKAVGEGLIAALAAAEYVMK